MCPANYEGMIPHVDDNVVYLPPEDYLTEEDSYNNDKFYVLLHEFAHLLQFSEEECQTHDVYGSPVRKMFNCVPMVEGFAEWASVKVAKDKGLTKIIKQVRLNHSGNKIPADMETYFSNDWVNDMGGFGDGIRTDRPYACGYAFSVYIAETYGDNIFGKIFTEGLDDKYWWDYNGGLTTKENQIEESKLHVEAIKAVTSQTVFKDFDEWYPKNKNKLYK